MPDDQLTVQAQSETTGEVAAPTPATTSSHTLQLRREVAGMSYSQGADRLSPSGHAVQMDPAGGG